MKIGIWKKIKRGPVSVLLLVFLLFSCEQEKASEIYPLHYSDAIMGTRFTIKVPRLPESITKQALKLQIKTLLDNINGQMSTYLASSELSQFNKKQSTQWVTVSAALFSVLKEAEKIAEISDGAFDITVAPLVNLWGFGPDYGAFKAPDDTQLELQLSKIGHKYLVLNNNTTQIRKLIPGLTLDLSAIAKGYAVDQVGLFLEKLGIVEYMVEIGGELKLKGNNIQQQPWRIAIEKPSAEQRVIHKVLPLTNISLATSGDYRNFFEIDGVRFSHSIDPRSGRPIKHKLASITILSDTTMKADALATALMVLGPEAGYELAEREQIAALFIIKTDNGFMEKVSSTFSQRVR